MKHSGVIAVRRGTAAKRFDIMPYLFVMPAFIVLLLFLIQPIVMAFGYSMTYFNILKPNAIRWNGFKNYAILLSDPLFFKAVFNTLRYTLAIVPIQCAFGLILAMLVNHKQRGIAIFRIAFFSPLLMSMTVVSILWTYILNPTPNQGLINAFLVKIGLEPCMFLNSSNTALYSIVGMSVWQGVGYQMMIFLAGLQGVPMELYEAAAIDGASPWRKFWNITLPSLTNVTVFVVLMMTMSAMKMFTQSFVMTRGGPDDSTRTIVLYIYQQGLSFHNIGLACAASVTFFLIVITVSFTIKHFSMDKN